MKNPEEKANPLYQEVRNNITKAAQDGGIKLIITIDTSWAGDTTIISNKELKILLHYKNPFP